MLSGFNERSVRLSYNCIPTFSGQTTVTIAILYMKKKTYENKWIEVWVDGWMNE